ncbi:MAG: ABC transporter permease [Anaerolineales bacterium]|nr:ABC transporter permease [Anaerolineales bacterium]
MLYELTQLALRNLTRARARLIMTAGGVLVGTAAVILLIAITVGLQAIAEAGIGSSTSLLELYVYPRYNPNGETPRIDQEAIQAIRAIPGVNTMIYGVQAYGIVITVDKLINYPSVFGIDPALLPGLAEKMKWGTPVLDTKTIVIGGRVEDNFFDPKASDYIPITYDLQTVKPRFTFQVSAGTRRLNYTISGAVAIQDTFLDGTLILPLSEVIRLKRLNGEQVDMNKLSYDTVLVRAASRDVTNDVANAIRNLGFDASGGGDYLNQLTGFFGTMRLMLGGVGGVALIVAAFGVANTMTMAILERTREIGIMKAIGATDRAILTVFLIEAGAVGFFGGLAGVGTALALGQVINNAVANGVGDGTGAQFLPIDVSKIQGNLVIIDPALILFGMILATVVGIGAGVLPALRASQMIPVHALRTE